MVLAMVVALAVPALAANGITKDEQDLYDRFCEVVDKWAAGHNRNKEAQQYKDMAHATLVQADLDSAACADLKAGIDTIDDFIAAYLKKDYPSTEAEVDTFVAAVVAEVNKISTKYELVVAVGKSNELSQVWYKNQPIVITSTPNPSNPSNPVVPQTGFDMTGTIIVAVVLAIALMGSAVIISKKRLAANN